MKSNKGALGIVAALAEWAYPIIASFYENPTEIANWRGMY